MRCSIFSKSTLRCVRLSRPEQENLVEQCLDRNRARPFTTSPLSRQERCSGGLFGLQDLKSADDWVKVTDRAICRVNEIRQKIDLEVSKSAPPPTVGSPLILANTPISEKEVKRFQRLLFLLDQISNEVCSIIDAAELCRNVHTSLDYILAAESCVMALSGFIHSLNADSRLYEIVSTIALDDELLISLGEEASYLARDLKREFESDGVHLLDREKKKLGDLHASLVETETLYRQTALASENPNDHQYIIGPFSSPASYSLIKQWLSNYVVQPPSSRLPPSSLLCSGAPKIGEALLSSIDDNDIRAKIWRETIVVPSSNAKTFGRLIQDRRLLAESLGYPTYAHKYLQNKVCSSPENVWNFLLETAEAVRPFANKEWDELLSLKKRLYSLPNATLQPWDIPFLTQKASLERQILLNGDRHSGRNAITELTKYLTVDACIESLKMISNELLGLKLHKVLKLTMSQTLFILLLTKKHCQYDSFMLNR